MPSPCPRQTLHIWILAFAWAADEDLFELNYSVKET